MLGFVICYALMGEVAAVDVPTTTVSSQEVETLARHYRIQIYNVYRTDRPTYDELFTEGQEVLGLSRRLPAKSPQQENLAEWFQTARQTTVEAKPELPPRPDVNLDLSEVVNDTRPHSEYSSRGADTESSTPTVTSRPWNSSTSSEGASSTKPAGSTATAEIGEGTLPLSTLGRLFFGRGSQPASRSAAPKTDRTRSAYTTLPSSAPADSSSSENKAQDQPRNLDEATEAALKAWENVEKDLEGAAAEFETRQAELAGATEKTSQELARERQKIESELNQSGPLGPTEAMELFVRITMLDVGNLSLGLGMAFTGQDDGSQTEQQFKATTGLLEQLRNRVTSKEFVGDARERNELLKQIDDVLLARQKRSEGSSKDTRP